MSTSIDDEIKRRDRHDIVVEILKTAIDGKIKTHIMYKAKLSYAQLNEYLPLLVEKGFLENTSIKQKKSLKRVYKTTQKGQAFLDNFSSIKKLWSYPTNSSS
jgi:predicted transcriptional regulator